MCSLRDAATDFDDMKVRVYGVSFDDVSSQAAFHKAQKLSFPLLSDPDGSVAQKYGVMHPRRPFARRRTFVIDDEGVVRAIDDKVDVSNHGGDLLKRIRELRG